MNLRFSYISFLFWLANQVLNDGLASLVLSLVKMARVQKLNGLPVSFQWTPIIKRLHIQCTVKVTGTGGKFPLIE
jgi:hypothetical protein